MNGSKECACVECLFFQTTDPILVFCCFLITRHVLMQHYYTHTDTDLSSLTLTKSRDTWESQNSVKDDKNNKNNNYISWKFYCLIRKVINFGKSTCLKTQKKRNYQYLSFGWVIFALGMKKEKEPPAPD